MQSEIKYDNPKQIVTEDIFGNLQMKCICGNPIFLYCSSLNCYRNGGICRLEDSICSKIHQTCRNTLIAKNLHKYINSKIIKQSEAIKNFVLELQKYIDKMIDNLSMISYHVQDKLKTFGLNNNLYSTTETIIKFYKAKQSQKKINQLAQDQNQEQDLNGQAFYYNLKQSYQNQQDSNWYQQSLNRFTVQIQKIHQKTNFYFYDIKEMIKEFHIRFVKDYSYKQYFKKYTIFNQLESKLNQTQQLKNLISILDDHIKFQSSQQIFSFSKFCNKTNKEIYAIPKYRLFEVVQGKNNLLFLIRNDKNKLFGFYTPSKFSSQNKSWIPQNQRHTKIFSLDYNLSQNLTNSNYSLIYKKQQGLILIGQIYKNKQQQNDVKQGNGLRINFNNYNLNFNDYNFQVFINLQIKKNCGLFSQSSISNNEINGVQNNQIQKPTIKNLQIYQLNGISYV